MGVSVSLSQNNIRSNQCMTKSNYIITLQRRGNHQAQINSCCLRAKHQSKNNHKLMNLTNTPSDQPNTMFNMGKLTRDKQKFKQKHLINAKSKQQTINKYSPELQTNIKQSSGLDVKNSEVSNSNILIQNLKQGIIEKKEHESHRTGQVKAKNKHKQRRNKIKKSKQSLSEFIISEQSQQESSMIIRSKRASNPQHELEKLSNQSKLEVANKILSNSQHSRCKQNSKIISSTLLKNQQQSIDFTQNCKQIPIRTAKKNMRPLNKQQKKQDQTHLRAIKEQMSMIKAEADSGINSVSQKQVQQCLIRDGSTNNKGNKSEINNYMRQSDPSPMSQYLEQSEVTYFKMHTHSSSNQRDTSNHPQNSTHSHRHTNNGGVHVAESMHSYSSIVDILHDICEEPNDRQDRQDTFKQCLSIYKQYQRTRNQCSRLKGQMFADVGGCSQYDKDGVEKLRHVKLGTLNKLQSFGSENCKTQDKQSKTSTNSGSRKYVNLLYF